MRTTGSSRSEPAPKTTMCCSRRVTARRSVFRSAMSGSLQGNSVGVRGIRLLEEDQVISMSILRHEEITPDVRHGYLGMARDRRRQMGEESEAAEAQIPEQPAEPDEGEGENGNGVGEAALTEEQFLD